MNIENYINQIVKNAKAASRIVASANTATKNAALNYIAEGIISAAATLKAEKREGYCCRTKRQDFLMLSSTAFFLLIAASRGMAEGVRQIIGLSDPVGQLISGHTRPNGLQIQKVRVPIGVIVIIYESRPNVTADAAALCLKAGNAVILRGGKESIHSNIAINKILTSALENAGLDSRCIQLIEIIERSH